MSIFLELLKCLLCCEEDERDHRHGSYDQFRTQTGFDHKAYEYRNSHKYHLPQPQTSYYSSSSSISPSPASLIPSPSKPVLSPYCPSPLSPKPPTSSSKQQKPSSVNTSPSLKLLASSSKAQHCSSVDSYSTFPKPPTPSKAPQSSSVDPGSKFPKPPPSSSKVQQPSSVDLYSVFSKPPTYSSAPNPPKASSKPPKPSPISARSSTYDPCSEVPKPPISSSKLPQSTSVNPSSSKLPQSTSVNPSSSSPKPPTSSKPTQTSSVNTSSPSCLSQLQKLSSANPSSASPKTSTSASNPTHSSSPIPTSQIPSPKSSSFSSKLSASISEKLQASSKSHPSSKKPRKSCSQPSPSSAGSPVSSRKHPPTFNPVLFPASSNATNQKGKKNYVWFEKSSLPIYAIPEDIKDLIKNDIVPGVLNKLLSPTTYKDYFAALLYAEEFYHEKWSHFNLKNVTLALHEARIHNKPEEEEKTFVELDMTSFPKERPFLLSRDFVYVRPSGSNGEHFEGIIYRIVRSSTILVEFEDDFDIYYDSSQKYDVSFSFNRVCLKRAHQAVKTASDALFRNYLFPDCTSRTSIPTAPALLSPCHKLDLNQKSAVHQILSIKGSPPYLVSGHLCVERNVFRTSRTGEVVERNVFRTSRTGEVVSEAVYQLCQASVGNKILICAPTNRCCDGLMRSLLSKGIPESDMFRANAAFREKEEVPDDILPSCLYEDPYFSCPPIEQLQKFRVIFSTFMSSYRLHDKGLNVGHFSHIFLVDASSANEPETLVPLTNFADQDTTVIVTGAPGDRPYWVRSDIARENGLKLSYFERLFEAMPYIGLNPMFITELDAYSSDSSSYYRL